MGESAGGVDQAGFAIGQFVALRADPERRGPVIAIEASVAGQPRYKVFHRADSIITYFQEQLLAVDAPASEPVDALYGPGLDPADFYARLTATRLRHPEIDGLYALHAARIQFVPFQFKPLMRLLRSDRPRILIADDVGVGKTIEAGLILRELTARAPLDRVLVVCPKALTLKWRAEMLRFDERFTILKGDLLRWCLDETQRDGVWPQECSRAIVPLELLRRKEVIDGTEGRHSRPGLTTIDPPPAFDLLIVDEAHHLRNPATMSHEVATLLCDVSEAAVFLSATPVQIGAQNLYSLLQMLRPELFPTFEVFREMIAPNTHLTSAIRLARFREDDTGWRTTALGELESAANTPWGSATLRGDPRFVSALDVLSSSDPTDEERVRLVHDLEELHPLAHVMNRTRRRDIGEFTQREPTTIAVEFLPEQREFYETVLAYRREIISLQHDARATGLLVDMLDRQASSSLPAVVPLLDTLIETGRLSARTTSDDPESEEDDFVISEELIRLAAELRRLARELPDADPKRDALVEIVRDTLETFGPRKLLVFSYFLHTLDYLESALLDLGVRVGVVTGRDADEEREELRRRFRLGYDHSDAIDVLLSSEVGCEGLDYEFCDRLVNYDIPWNPMRIEQRIGRIDRFGQRSPKVLIFNFVTPGTVEERIFHRCFDRLDIFRRTVGDLEEVLGTIVDDLGRLALRTDLTDAQLDERIRQMTDNVVRRAQEQHRLEEEAQDLLGLDNAFIADVEDAIAHERFVTPAALRRLVDHWLSMQGGRLDEESDGNVRIEPGSAGQEIARRLRTIDSHDPTTPPLVRLLESGGRPSITFDQDVAAERRSISFITPLHPLARAASTDLALDPGEVLVSHLRLNAEQTVVEPCVYVIELWETIALRSETRLVIATAPLAGGPIDLDLGDRLLGLLPHSAPATAPTATYGNLDRALQTIDEHLYERRRRELAGLAERSGRLLERRLQSVETHARARLARIDRDLATITEPKIVRMRTAERRRVTADLETRRRDLEARRGIDVVARRIAMGTLETADA
ncbi:MAG: SNF2-related protein [Acidimicrobiia bacterium]|nr:SNF2-related protein [Acidimicrobiia bacterium]